MYVSMHACMYVFIICMYGCIYLSIYPSIYLSIHLYMNICMYVCMYIYVNALLCPHEKNAMYHQLECISGKCNICGQLSLLQLPSISVDTSMDVLKWKKYEYVTITLDGGGESRRIQLIDCKTSVDTFLYHFKRQLYPYIEHIHTTKWQDRQFHACLESFPPWVVISVIHFAENYTFAHQQEIQSDNYFSE